jgi:cytochrome c oxidase subunit 2
MKPSICAGLLLLAAALPVHAATPAQAAACTACHGEQGRGNALLGAPRLAGQQADYLLQQLRNFKIGRRGYDARDAYGAQMRAVVDGLEERDFESLARYFAGQDVAAAQVTPATRGQALYQGTCAACHGPRGEGFAHLKTPNLRILDAAYLGRQLAHYVEGVRGGEAHADELGIWMRGISLQVGGDEERGALVDYIVGLSAASPEDAGR